MIDMITDLADEIAALRRFAATVGDIAECDITNHIADLLATVLQEFCEDPSVLTGEMPWWKDWPRDH